MLKLKHLLLHPKQALLLHKWKRNSGLNGFEHIRVTRQHHACDDFVELSWRVYKGKQADPNSLYTRCLWSELEETIRLFEGRDLPMETQAFLQSLTH